MSEQPPPALFVFLDFLNVGDTWDNFLIYKTFQITFPLPDPEAQHTSEKFRGSRLGSHVEGKSIFCCEKWGRGVNTSCPFRRECEHIKKTRENLLLPAREPFKAFSWLALGLRGRQEKAAVSGGGRRNRNKIILKIASMTFPISPELELQDWDLNSTCFKFIGIMSRQQPLFN